MAVYTDVAADDLARFLADYDIGELLSYKGIAEGVENSNFLVHTKAGSFILTLYEKRVAAKDLPFFLGLMEHLAARGITCPQPVKNRQGGMLGTLAGRPAALVTFLDGMWMRRISTGHCAAVGEALAKLHLAGADFKMKRVNALAIAKLAAALRASQGPRRQRARRPERCNRKGTRRAGKIMAARSAAGRDPRRSVSRQCLLPRRQIVRADRFLFRLHRRARLRRLRSASTPGASRPITPSTSPRAARCSRPMRKCVRSPRPSARRCPFSRAARRCAFC